MLPKEPWLEPHVPEGKVALDVGANVGDFSTHLSGRFERVIAFEPHPAAVKELRERGVEVKEAAVGEKPGTLKLNLYGESAHTSAVVYDDPQLNVIGRGTPTGELEVPMVSIDGLEVGKVDFIKIDTEGFEREVLRGAAQTLERDHPDLLIEVHCGEHVEEIKSLLRSLDYEMAAVPHPNSDVSAHNFWISAHRLSVGVGVLTFNHIEHGRQEDFRRCWETIEKTGYPAAIHLLTNGSTDGTEDVVRELGGIVDDGNPKIWYGNTRLIEAMGEVDLIVLSADDLEYEENWLRRLASFIAKAPEDIALFSAQMEPVWEWNTPRETLECGGEKGLVRDSVPGSSWVFRRRDWETWMGPFPSIMPGEDLEVCKRIKARGKRMVALDLVEHLGVERSAWGNQSHTTATPLDKEAWGLVG